MFVREASDGNWYVCRITSSNHAGRRKQKNPSGKNRTYRNWFLIKFNGTKGSSGRLTVKTLTFPKEFIGKRIRLKVDVLK